MKLRIALLLGLFSFFGCSQKERFVQVAEQVVHKTVSIYVSGKAERSFLILDENGIRVEKKVVPISISGAGVLVSDNNHVLTCAHLFFPVEITGITICSEDGNCTAGNLLLKEERNDLALLQSYFATPTPYAKLADPRELKVGQEVVAVGNPLGFPFTVTTGIISALHRDNLGVYNMTQSDATLNPGNSGGPLFNLKGEIVGINSRIVPPVPAPVFTGLGFSVPSSTIIVFLTQFRGADQSIPKFDLKYWQKVLKIFNLIK